MIGYLGLPAIDIGGGNTAAPGDHEIRYTPYQEKQFSEKEAPIL